MNEKGEVLVEVKNISKKFCKNLKLSLWYGFKDIFNKTFGIPIKSDLRKSEFWSVKDVNFTLRRGECIGLIGHNGAGKSSLLKILNGLYTPDEGEVIINGKVGALIELGAGFNPILTGRENIYNNAAILGFDKAQVDEKLDSIIKFSEIEDFIDTPVKNYSSGMKVRLGFAVAAYLNPDVLIIDEVLAVGDLAFKLKCYKKIDEILPRTAVIFVSHNMAQVSRICSDIILMNHGKVEYQGEDVSKGIELYYGKTMADESITVFDSGEVALKDFNIQNSKGDVVIDWNDNLEIEVELAILNKQLKKVPVVIIGIFDKEDREVATFKRNNNDKAIKRDSVLYKISVENLQLSRGIYYINISVSEEKQYNPMLRINYLKRLVVKDVEEVWPAFNLEATYVIEV